MQYPVDFSRHFANGPGGTEKWNGVYLFSKRNSGGREGWRGELLCCIGQGEKMLLVTWCGKRAARGNGNFMLR